MNIKYKIIKINTEDHSITVRYYTDKLTEEYLTSFKTYEGKPIYNEDGSLKGCRTDYNLNIWQVPAPTEEELEKYIILNAPAAWLTLQEKILDPNTDTSMSGILTLLNIEKNISKS
jgi:hypothetical protein